MAPTPPGAWNSYAGSELDFPSPASIGGIATIATAPSNYPRYDGYGDYYGHMAAPGGAMTPGAYSSHSPSATSQQASWPQVQQQQGQQQQTSSFLAEVKSEAVETTSSLMTDHVTTTNDHVSHVPGV